MALDAGIHHLGTKMIHQIPGWLFIVIGILAGSPAVQGVGVGIMLTLLVGNMRCRAPYYRYRIRDAGPQAAELQEGSG